MIQALYQRINSKRAKPSQGFLMSVEDTENDLPVVGVANQSSADQRHQQLPFITTHLFGNSIDPNMQVLNPLAPRRHGLFPIHFVVRRPTPLTTWNSSCLRQGDARRGRPSIRQKAFRSRSLHFDDNTCYADGRPIPNHQLPTGSIIHNTDC